MQDFKIEHFAREHPTTAFPWYRPLTPPECRSLLRSVARTVGATGDAAVVIQRISAMSAPLPRFDATSPHFRLSDVFDFIRVRPGSNVFINWYRFDDIDEIHASDLMRFFTDIWYPASDDIEVFDEGLGWILSVGHEGDVSALILPGGAN